MKNPSAVIIEQIVTEKSSLKKIEQGYVFKVALNANKIDVHKAVEKAFGVSVVSVNTVNCSGKNRIMRGKLGHTSRFKKAYVRLKPGQTIEKIDAAV